MKKLLNLTLIITTILLLLIAVGCQQRPAPVQPETQAPQTEPVTPPESEITPEPTPPQSPSPPATPPPLA